MHLPQNPAPASLDESWLSQHRKYPSDGPERDHHRGNCHDCTLSQTLISDEQVQRDGKLPKLDSCLCAATITVSDCWFCGIARCEATKQIASYDRLKRLQDGSNVELIACECGTIVDVQAYQPEWVRKCATCGGIVTVPFSNFAGTVVMFRPHTIKTLPLVAPSIGQYGRLPTQVPQTLPFMAQRPLQHNQGQPGSTSQQPSTPHARTPLPDRSRFNITVGPNTSYAARPFAHSTFSMTDVDRLKQYGLTAEAAITSPGCQETADTRLTKLQDCNKHRTIILTSEAAKVVLDVCGFDPTFSLSTSLTISASLGGKVAFQVLNNAMTMTRHGLKYSGKTDEQGFAASDAMGNGGGASGQNPAGLPYHPRG